MGISGNKKLGGLTKNRNLRLSFPFAFQWNGFISAGEDDDGGGEAGEAEGRSGRRIRK